MSPPRGVRLTAEQRQRVREMVEDEGATRAEAVAWVLAFEPTPESWRLPHDVAMCWGGES
jgi:hypothetical protein